jgi:hypothetical protein
VVVQCTHEAEVGDSVPNNRVVWIFCVKNTVTCTNFYNPYNVSENIKMMISTDAKKHP